jgi:hypothetical protein
MYEFSEDQKKYIRGNWEKESIHSMKNKIGCTWYAISKFAEKDGLELPGSNAWPKEKEEVLEKLSKNILLQR